MGEQIPQYSISIYRFNEDRVNGEPAGSDTSYEMDEHDFNAVRINDVIKGVVIPGPFKGYNIIDIDEILPTKDVIDDKEQIF